MFRYETHLHTYPVSKCATATVRESLEFYKNLGYDGVFITNHFLDGNINSDRALPYDELIEFYFSDYEEAKCLESEIGINVFLGVESSYKGTDFLIYGLTKEWFLAHPEIQDMKKSDQLSFFIENDALVIQAHPFREASYIDHIRLFPRNVHGVEIVNASRGEFENAMARSYAEAYGLVEFAGSDNHAAQKQRLLAGVSFESAIKDERDFAKRVKNSEAKIFTLVNPLI